MKKKTISLFRASIAAVSLTIVVSAGHAQPTQPVATVPAVTAPADPWTNLKDLTFDRRDVFLAGLKSLVATVDKQVAELTARRAVMEQKAIDAKDWDFAMAAMTTARSYLLGTVDEMAKADRDTWDQRKERVGVAWTDVEDAYAKVKASTTAV